MLSLDGTALADTSSVMSFGVDSKKIFVERRVEPQPRARRI